MVGSHAVMGGLGSLQEKVGNHWCTAKSENSWLTTFTTWDTCRECSFVLYHIRLQYMTIQKFFMNDTIRTIPWVQGIGMTTTGLTLGDCLLW